MAVACAIYLQIGWWFRHNRPRLACTAAWGLPALVVGFHPRRHGLARPLDLKLGYFGTPVLSLATSVLISAGLILCANTISMKFPAAAAVWVSRCAMADLTVVLRHPLSL